MHRPKGVIATVWIALAATVFAPQTGGPAAAQEKPPAPPAPGAAKSKFENDLAAIRRTMTEARWKDATAAIAKLLTDHEGSPEVVAQLAAIEDMLKRATFKAQWKPTPLATLIGGGCTKVGAGNVAEFDTSPGVSSSGWTRIGDVAVFDRPFEGEVTISFEWDWIRGLYVVPPPPVLLAYDAEKKGGYLLAMSVRTSSYSSGAYVTGLVIRVDDGAQKEIGRDPDKMFYEEDLKGTVTYERTAASLGVRLGKKELSRANETKYRSGSVAMVASDAGFPKSARVKGKLAESYVRRIRAEAENEDYRVWESSAWARDKALPAWILKSESGTNAATAILPADAQSQEFAALRARIQRWYAGELAAFKGAENEIREAPKSVARYVRGLIALGEGRLDEADECFRVVVGGDPTFGPAHLGIARVDHARGNTDEAKRRLEDLRRLSPSFAPIYIFAAQIALREDDIAGARKALDEAAARGAMSGTVNTLRTALHRMENGPPWTKRFTVQTAHFDVFTDHSQAVCGEVAKQLEDAFSAYQTNFRAVTQKRRAKVYVFSGQQSYLDYAADMGSDLRNTLGVYMPALRQLAVFLHDDRVELWNTVRHEGFHQYLHQLADDVPIWFNEGYAEFFGFSRRISGKTTVGRVAADQAGLARALLPKFRPVAELMRMEPQAFMADAGVHYVESWALVQFLRETKDPALAGRLGRYFDALLAGRSAAQAYDEVMAPVAAAIDSALKQYVGSLSSR